MDSFRAALRAALGSPAQGHYRLIVVHHSMAALERLTLRLAHDPTIVAHRIKLVEWGPDTRLSTVLVRVHSSPAAAARYLQARYGPGLITTTHWIGPRPQALSALGGSRHSASVSRILP